MTTFVTGDRSQHSDLEACQLEVDQLREALDTRPVIDQAKGMLIARHGCSPDEAFRMLSAASQRENRKLRDVAEAMVEGARRDSP
jgi:AmiR/NasT family two-component response regulator